MPEGKVVDLTDTYKQKLESFDFLIEKVGKDRFYDWYRKTVETGNVDARVLLGSGRNAGVRSGPASHTPVWLVVLVALVIIVVVVVGFYATRRDRINIRI